MNYSHGVASFCLDKIVQHGDLMDARARITRERRDGKTVLERIEEQKGVFSAGKAFDCGLMRIGKTVFNRVTKNMGDVRQNAADKIQKERLALVALIAKANEIRSLGKSPDKLTVAQIKVLLAPLKRRGDKALPSKKIELLTRLTEWEERAPLLEEAEIDAVVAEGKEQEQAAAAANDTESESEEFGETELM